MDLTPFIHGNQSSTAVFGPIESTETSHPFSAMRFSRLGKSSEEYGYLEEEYFISGYANIYDLNQRDELSVVRTSIPYRTRLLIRRPVNQDLRKPRVFLDILNATNGYDIEDLWRRSWQYIMENNYSYVGITSKPINVLALKHFDYQRYQSLNWGNGQNVPFPDVPDALQRLESCEEGLIWDMLTQTGNWIKGEGRRLFAESPLELYLTGQSQSGIYLNTYVNQFHPFLYEMGCCPFDGYLSLVSGGFQRSLCQTHGKESLIQIRDYPEREINIPFITLNSEGDFSLFAGMGADSKGVRRSYNSDTPEDKRRYYEVAAAPHTNAASPLIPLNSELDRCHCARRLLDGEYSYRLNDFPLDYLINGMLERLHAWSADGVMPPRVPPLKMDEDGQICRDCNGNAMGGIRTAFTEIPKAFYKGSIGAGKTDGTMNFFTQEQFNRLYSSRQDYLARFNEYAKKQADCGDITQSDLQRMIQWAENVWE